MGLFNMLRNKKFLEQWDWIDSLSESGGYQTVGVGMIAQLHKVIRETYKAGFEDGEKASKQKVQTPRGVCSRKLSRQRAR